MERPVSPTAPKRPRLDAWRVRSLALILAATAALASILSATAYYVTVQYVWPGTYTKTGYVYWNDICNYQALTWSHWMDANITGYSSSVYVGSYRFYGGSFTHPTEPIYWTSGYAWDSYGHLHSQPFWPGTYGMSTSTVTVYPYITLNFTASNPAYVEAVIADDAVSAGCRFSNYMQMFPQ